MLLALTRKMDEGPATVGELGDLAGFPLAARLDGAHSEGIQAYVDDLDREERERLREALAIAP